MGAAAEEVDRAEDGTISGCQLCHRSSRTAAYSERKGGNLWLELELILALEVVDQKSCRSEDISSE